MDDDKGTELCRYPVKGYVLTEDRLKTEVEKGEGCGRVDGDGNCLMCQVGWYMQGRKCVGSDDVPDFDNSVSWVKGLRGVCAAFLVFGVFL